MVYNYSTMIYMVFMPLLWPVISGHLYNLECGAEDVPDFTIEPSDDGVLGRYLIQWCSQLTNPTIEKWTFFLYTRNVSNKDCEFYKITDKLYIHSRIEQKIHKTFECSAKTCISTYLDLVYTGCYTIQSEFHLAQNQRQHDYRLRYIASGLDSLDDINNMKSAFITESLGDNVMLKMDSRIPLTDYFVRLCSDDGCAYIEDKCTVSRLPGQQLWSARCVAPPPGTNRSGEEDAQQALVPLAALVSHVSPWAHGVVFSPDLKDVYLNFSYSHAGGGSAGGSPARSAEWGVRASASLALALAGALAALAAFALTRRCTTRKQVDALHRYNNMPSPLPPKVPAAPPSDVVVLVYSRDVPVLMQAADCLAAAIHHNRIGRVVSLYSAATASACGGGGADWLRGLLSQGARVVVLQTPALLASTKPHAVLPSGVGVSPAGAHFGDVLVTLALRCLLSAHAHAHADAHAYRTYYVANLSASPCEVVPLVSPYRRYELPEALPTLLDHLAPGGVTNTDAMLMAMKHMATYVDFVRNNPDYLKDLTEH